MVNKSIAVVGLGLIGASLALGLKPYYRVIGYDNSEETCSYAIKHKVVDVISPIKDFSGVECVIVCTPVSTVRDTVISVYNAVGDTAVITDVGSVKRNLAGCPGRIVGGHPMAGTEHSGIAAAKPHLFENACYCVVPYERSTDSDVRYVCELAKLVKAIPLVLSAEEHDKAVADYSHAPHLIAYALSSSAIGDNLTVAGSGFMDTTRIAGSDEAFWSEVCRLNRQNVLNSLDKFSSDLQNLRRHLINEDYEALRAELGSARAKRKTLSAMRGADSDLNIFVDIKDEIGSIDGVVKLLCAGGVNIANIKILNSREGVGGALSITLGTVKDARAAAQILSGAGYTVT